MKITASFFSGFSKGAYVACFLAEMLNHVGLLNAGNGRLLLGGSEGKRTSQTRGMRLKECLTFYWLSVRPFSETFQ